MLLVPFHVGNERYALEARRVVEVVPIVELRPMPRAPAFVVGLANYRGAVVPVVDIRRLLHDQPSELRLSTRILFVEHGVPGGPGVLGLLAERVTEAIERQEAEFRGPSLATDATRFLGRILTDDEGMLQLIATDRLLPDDCRYLVAGTSGDAP